MSETQPQGQLEETITVRIRKGMSVDIMSASALSGLSKSDIIRLGLERSIPALTKQLAIDSDSL